MLFWEALQCNKRFRSFIIDTDRAHDFVVLVPNKALCACVSLYYRLSALSRTSAKASTRRSKGKSRSHQAYGYLIFMVPMLTMSSLYVFCSEALRVC
jgi:hypothetical protein